MTLANKITIARILLIPVFVLMALSYGRTRQHGAPETWQLWSALAAFLLAAASDGIDGYIARRWNQRTHLGQILDPIADKGLLLAGIITLSVSNWAYEFPLWFPVLVITRDVIVVGGALVLHYLHGSVEVRPSWVGKCATASQMVALALVMLFAAALGHFPFDANILTFSVWLAGFFTATSGVGYLADGLRQLQTHGHCEPP